MNGVIHEAFAYFFDRSDEDIRAVVETNLLSPIYCCREFGRIMKYQGNGYVMFISRIFVKNFVKDVESYQ